MNAHGIRHLVVAENNKPVDIISIRDVLQAFAQQQLEGDGPGDGRFTRNNIVLDTAEIAKAGRTGYSPRGDLVLPPDTESQLPRR